MAVRVRSVQEAMAVGASEVDVTVPNSSDHNAPTTNSMARDMQGLEHTVRSLYEPESSTKKAGYCKPLRCQRPYVTVGCVTFEVLGPGAIGSALCPGLLHP